MKKSVADLLYNLPINQSRKKRISIIIVIIIILLVGCKAYVATEMPEKFVTYFSDSSDKLVDDLYLDYTNFEESKNYRLAVEGIVSDVNYKQLLITVTAISKEAREKFDNNIYPRPVIIKGSGSGSESSYPSFENKYKMEFYYDMETTSTECVVILCEDYEDNNAYALGAEVFEATEKLINQSGNSLVEITDDDERTEIFNKALKQVVKDKNGIMLEFPIASKDNKSISVKIDKNNSQLSYNVGKVEINRTTLSIESCILGLEEQNIEGYTESYMEIMPTIYVVLEDGTKQLLTKGKMGYEPTIEDCEELVSSSQSGCRIEGVDITQERVFIKPIDLDEITKVIVNDIEYDIK